MSTGGFGGIRAVLYSSGRTRVQRIAGPDGRPVIRKEMLGADRSRRARREGAILKRLAEVPGVIRWAGRAEAGVVLLEDAGDTTLAALAGGEPLPPAELVRLAGELAAVVAGVHRAGVVHKDLNPANVMIVDGRPILIDFDLATTAAEERPGFTHASQIAGTLAYLAPEQTGRTGRPVDRRSDLYALGATLYELATGRPPFESGDPLRMIHDHLARVPERADLAHPGVPPALAAIIARLLEKEPDRRYQSAEGLAYDLGRVTDGELVLGARDFAARLGPPSRLVGRDAELAELRAAFAAAVRGESPSLLITGPAGVGKTALISELRPTVTAGAGWLVTGKFDQHRRDAESNGVARVLRGLGGLLLAEPDDVLDRLRPELRLAVGSNGPIVATVLPEFGVLLATAPEPAEGDQAESEARLTRGVLDLLAVAITPARPVVLVIDDLQWSTGSSLRFVDQLWSARIPGLLLICTYREAEVDSAHPLAALLLRWARTAGPRTLRLADLPGDDLAVLLGEMLRMDPAAVAGLAAAVGGHTGGNPFDTVEFVNALRQDGLLVAGEEGWEWDERAVRTYVGEGGVVDLLAARIARLPRPTRQLVKVLACLGGETAFPALRAAYPVRGGWLGSYLSPALEDGLLVAEGEESVRFRHDRVQQAAYGSLSPTGRRLMHLVLARRLARHPDFESLTAQQYLPATALINDLGERRRVAATFRSAAAALKLVNAVVAEQYLAAGLELLAVDRSPLRTTLETERHRALCSLGRLAEADVLYQEIEHRPDPLSLADAASVQITSLTIRDRPQDAVDLGLDVLRRLSVAVPRPEELAAEVQRGLERLRSWAARADVGWDTARAELGDPRMAAAATVILRMMAPSFFAAQGTMGWLVVTAQRLWEEHGPNAHLLPSLGHAGALTIAFGEDYRTGYDTLRHLITVGDARGWVAESCVARFLASVAGTHWFEPVESAVRLAQEAREGLLQAGDLQYAVATFHTSVASGFDCANDLEGYSEEIAAGVALAARTGDEAATATMVIFSELVRVLTGAPSAPGLDEPAAEPGRDANQWELSRSRTSRAIAAAIFGDAAALSEHAAAAERLLAYVGGTYQTSTVHLLCALGGVGDPGAHRDWLAARAVDAPANFRHLVHFLDAERAWAAGRFVVALTAYDAALGEADERARPWHHGLIAERHGLRLLERGLEFLGRQSLADACRCYRAWGASAKVRALEQEHPFLRTIDRADPPSTRAPSTSMSGLDLDLMGVLQASQALSSETNLDRLRSRVAEILGTLTGATAIRLLLCDDGRWILPPEPGGSTLPVERAGAAGLVPLTVFRYVERTGQPLLVDDALRDDRFARDPYLAGLDRCSLLAIPVLSQGVPRAMLLLENTLTRGAFTEDRLGAVRLVAGQLAVSIENAQLYGSLERKVAERTEALREANERLEVISRTDPLTGLANRRQLDSRLDAAWEHGARLHEPLSVAMVDIDHFKLYNDHYGHLAGDACLQRVADALNATIRVTDLVARYGGEEFALILPGADVAVAQVIAERAREAVLALGEANAAAPGGRVTVSIGVASVVPADTGEVARLVESADAELYAAKRAGRNRVSTLVG